jgi:hypothetical protein
LVDRIPTLEIEPDKTIDASEAYAGADGDDRSDASTIAGNQTNYFPSLTEEFLEILTTASDTRGKCREIR